jgi:hypothetical protein
MLAAGYPALRCRQTLEREQSLIVQNAAVHMYNPSTLKASLDTSDSLARRADALPYVAMHERNMDMCAKVR